MSYKLIENENDIYLELPKEKIKFASKEAETIYDLSLENDFLTRENQELKKQIENKENQQKKFIEYLEKEIIDSSTCSGQQYYARQHLKLYKEIIGDKE